MRPQLPRSSNVRFSKLLSFSFLFFSTVLGLTLATTLFILPSQAQTLRQQPAPSDSTTLDNLLNLFRRRRPTWEGISRSSTICLVSPGRIGITNQVWSDRPLFVWQGKVSHITLRNFTSNALIWDQPVDSTSQQMAYSDRQPLLQSGQIYQWRLEYPDPETNTTTQTEWLLFRVLSAEQRQQITDELTRIAQTDQSEEAIAAQQAEYLVSQELLSDGLQVLYQVKNPSPQVHQLIQQIETEFCPPPTTPQFL